MALIIDRRTLRPIESGSIWTPANLYTTESGDWWLPTPGYVFEDAGVTAATDDGDALYQISGQRGVINLVQSSAAARPTLQLAEVNGNPAFRFDGTDDLFGTFSLTLPNPGELSFFAAFKSTSASGHFFQPEHATNGEDPSSEFAGGALYLNGGNGPPNYPEISIGSMTGSWKEAILRDRGATHQIWTGGVEAASSSSAVTYRTGATTIQPFRRGELDNAIGFFTGDIACCGFITRYLTDAEMALLSTYLGGLIA